MKYELIGHVAVDSGQLLLCDPGYIDSQWENEDFTDIRVYQHRTTKDKLTFGKDFVNYEEIIDRYGKTMNQLNHTGDWEEIPRPDPKHGFSYNACAQATLSDKRYGELKFKLGHIGAGVAFSTAFGDGMYPVYAKYSDDDTLQSVEVIFWADDEE